MDDGSSSCNSISRGESEYKLPSLPEDLIGKIIARLPYPDIIQARCLSKLWRHLLSADSPHVEAFQDEVGSVSSTSWPSFAPVVQQYNCLYGYHAVCNNWRIVTTPSSAKCFESSGVTHGALEGDGNSECIIHCAGSLVCRFENRWTRSRTQGRSSTGDVYWDSCHYWASDKITVMNIVTGSFKVFNTTPVPKEGKWQILDTVFHAKKSGFIIALLCRNLGVAHLDLALQVFDSGEGRWCTDYLPSYLHVTAGRVTCCCRLIEESKVIFFVSDCFPPKFLEYDCTTKAWSCDPMDDEFAKALDFLLLCGPRVILISSKSQYHYERSRTLVIQVQEYIKTSNAIITLEEFKVDEYFGETVDFSSDEEHVYLCCETETKQLLSSYNVNSGEWKELPTLLPAHPEKVPFQRVNGSYCPGLNPFCNPAIVPDYTLTSPPA